MIKTQELIFLQILDGEWVVSNLSTVPVIALGLGPVAGLGAARMVTSHFHNGRKSISIICIWTPGCKRVGEDLSKEELGGTKIHSKNGSVDIIVKTEDEAFQVTKKILSFLPSSVYELSTRG